MITPPHTAESLLDLLNEFHQLGNAYPFPNQQHDIEGIMERSKELGYKQCLVDVIQILKTKYTIE
jgi:hypothetical protein